MKINVVIVGSGAGGATLAKELATQGRKVTVIEKGKRIIKEKVGSTRFAARKLYSNFGLLKSKEGVVIYRTIAVGGTTIVSCANAVRSLQKELANFGIDLTEEFFETERELGVMPVPDKNIIRGSKIIMGTANDLNYIMHPMPKNINFKNCISCGNCVLGCKYNAKWTAENFVDNAIENNATLITDSEVIRVLVSDGTAVGIKTKKHEILADKVVLAAGGLGTPEILQKSGLEAGQKLFCDLFTVVYMKTRNLNQLKGITMATVNHDFYDSEKFILSPFIDPWLSLLFSTHGRTILRDRILGIMVKIADESVGRVFPDGKFEKIVTSQDMQRLNAGESIAKEILMQAGGEIDSIFITPPRGAHPGGTAAISEVVNGNLETQIKNLYVCDASVIPIAPGLPPIVTIVSLAKWLAKRL